MSESPNISERASIVKVTPNIERSLNMYNSRNNKLD